MCSNRIVKSLEGSLRDARSQCARRRARQRTALNSCHIRTRRRLVGWRRREVTELWTFMRARGGIWLLSAIQQA